MGGGIMVGGWVQVKPSPLDIVPYGYDDAADLPLGS